MPDLTHVPADVADHLDPPPFDALVVRGVRRRRRRTTSLVTGAVVAVAVLAATARVVTGDSAAPEPPAASPTVLSPSEARALIHERGAVVTALGLDDEGRELAVWAHRRSRESPSAVAVRAADGAVALGMAPGALDDVVPVTGGWLAESTNDGSRTGSVVLIGPDASVTTLPAPTGTTTPQPGDAAIWVGLALTLYRPATHELFEVPAVALPDSQSNPVVTASGSLVTLLKQADTVSVARLEDGAWVTHELDGSSSPSAHLLGGGGDTLATVVHHHREPETTSYDVVHLSTDAGATWRVVPAPPRLGSITSIATTTRGTTFMTTSYGLLRVPAEGDAELVAGTLFGGVLTDGDRIMMSNGRIYSRSDDEGASWTVAAVPGREDAPVETLDCGFAPTPGPDQVLVSFGCLPDHPERAAELARVAAETSTEERLTAALTAYFAGPPPRSGALWSLGSPDTLRAVVVEGDRAIVDLDLDGGIASTSAQSGEIWAALTTMAFQFPEIEVMEPRYYGSCVAFGAAVGAGECLVVQRDGDYVPG